MKKLLYFLALTAFAFGPISCSKDEDPAPAAPTLPTTAEALSEHDSKSGGVYKGTFANETSSGTFKATLQGGKTEILMAYNGTTKTLTTTELSGWTSGDLIDAVTFANGTWSVDLSIDADGTPTGITLNLDSQTGFTLVLSKELSAIQIKVYEGTYAGSSSGKWNFLLQGDQILGLYYSATSNGTFTGSASGNSIAVSDGTSVNAIGTFAGEGASASGTWTGSSSNGTWTGTRKL